MYLILKKTRQGGGGKMNIFILHTYDIEKSKKDKLVLMWEKNVCQGNPGKQ